MSKGGNTLIFLFAASILQKEEYINLLSLYSLEGLFIIISPFYYTDVLFKLRDKYSFLEINKEISKLIILYGVILLSLLLVFSSFVFNFYGFKSYILLISIVIILIGRLSFQAKSVNNQIDENHNKAVMLKALPFFSSFVFGLLGFLFSENKIAGFFIGRALSFIVISIKRRYFRFTSFDYNINFSLLADILKRAINLIVLGLGGWFLGYGMLNILKFNYNEDVNFKIGLILNLWSLFLLFANGINGVYMPKFRKLYKINTKSADKLFQKTLIIYFSILAISIIFYFVINLIPIDSSLFDFKDYINIFPYVLLIFFAQIFQYVSIPYFVVKDEFKKLAIVGLITNIISFTLIFTHHFYQDFISINVISIIIICYCIRSLPIYFLRKKNLSFK